MMAAAEFERGRDGSASLVITRSDGTRVVTHPAASLEQLRRELARWSIERHLRLPYGFYRLVAGGADPSLFPGRDGERRAVDDPIAVEPWIDLVDSLREGLVEWTTAEIHGYAAEQCARRRVRPLPPIQETELRNLVQEVDANLTRWQRLSVGQSVRLAIDW